MASFAFKKVETTSMKVTGVIDIDAMTIDVDGEMKRLSTLLSPFNGGAVEINVKVRDEEELEMPDETRLL